MKIKELGNRFMGTLVGSSLCFSSGLFVDFPRPGRMLWSVTLAGLVIGLFVDFGRFLASREGNTFGNTLFATMLLPPLYVTFELAMRVQWPDGPGQSYRKMLFGGLAAGLVIDFARYLLRRRARRPSRNHTGSNPFHT